MNEPAKLTWAQLPATFRTLARWITIAQAAGYGVSLVFARQSVERFRIGVDGAAAHDLLQSAHSHLLGMTALFAISGACFALCEKPPEPLKSIVLAAPFAAIMIAFIAIWLMKYSGLFAWPMIAANFVMTVAFYFQIITTLRELRRARNAEPRT